MPWCPKCKTEYIEGIEVCADCHTPLVASLEEDKTQEEPAKDKVSDGEKDLDDQSPDNEDEIADKDTDKQEDEEEELTEEDLSRKLREHTATYVRPEEKYCDTRSSGYMLTILGAAGLIVLLLIITDVIHLSLDPVMQYIFYGVLAVLFVVFLVMGISSLKKAGEYKKRMTSEKESFQNLLDWLCSDEQKTRLDRCHDGETSPEEAYFACQELMKQMLLQKEPDIKEEYMNYIIEKAYNQLYES